MRYQKSKAKNQKGKNQRKRKSRTDKSAAGANIIMNVIKQRRSVREFKKEGVSKDIIRCILEAGRWAPSGLNNQPWRFMVLEKEKKDALAQFTHYSRIVQGCDKLILVFLDREKSYNYEKDLMALGACIQNMLLYIHQQKLGACWLGEILNQKGRIQQRLRVPKRKEFFGCIALGVPARTVQSGRRRPLKTLIDKP